MSGYDRGAVYSHASFPGDQPPPVSGARAHVRPAALTASASPRAAGSTVQEAGAQAKFLEFIREFRVDNNFIYRYRPGNAPRAGARG